MSPRLSWQKRLFYFFVRFPVNFFFMIFYGVRYYGRNHLPETGGIVLICNHQSHFDPPLLAAGLRRRLNFLARKSLFKFKPFAWLIDMLDAIPLDIEGIGFEGIKESLKRLRGGEIVLVFPEGGRTWDGNIAPFLTGSLSLAQRSRSVILPAAISGCYEAFPRTKKFPVLWGRIRVVYGKPIPYEVFQHWTEEELRKHCETVVAALCREAQDRQKQHVPVNPAE
jgi:1-acyl-sn-glycerol-3-phosphate acyltransferase